MDDNVTPSRRQYLEIKKQHPDEILFFRTGDFYETFDEDAEIASRELDLVLTSKSVGKDEGRIPMAGIPYHAVDNYLSRLVERDTTSRSANSCRRRLSTASARGRLRAS